MTDQGGNVHAGHDRTAATKRHLQLTLPACGQPVLLARQVVCEVWTAWRLPHVEETAVLLVSELVTNAAQHATSTDAIIVELQVVQTWLRIEAYRSRPGLGVPHTTDELDESGFGFALVDCLAGQWGWIAWPASGEVRETVNGKPVQADGPGLSARPA